MPDFQSMYLQLFNAVTDAVRILERAQQDTEQTYMAAAQAPLTRLNDPNGKTE